jgi:hypothetical protein
MRLSSLVVALPALLALTSTGCTSKAPGTTPKASVHAFVQCMQNRDAEGIYVLLSTGTKAEIENELQQMKQGLMEDKKQKLGQIGLGPDRLAAMSGKDYFIAFMDASFKMMDAFAESFGTKMEFDFEVGQETIDGDSARVIATDRSSNKVHTFELVREGTHWFLVGNPAQN